jgi:hypothetical protein
MNLDEIKDDVKVKMSIEPGIHENVVILDMEEPDGANYITVKFGRGDNELYTKWYTNEEPSAEGKQSAMDIALRKAKHLAGAVLTDEEKAAITGKSQYELLKNALRKCVGKTVPKFKFIGEQFIRKDGTIGLQTKIGFSPFAEGVVETTGLKYNENNPYDFKRIPVTEVKAKEASDNPFV